MALRWRGREASWGFPQTSYPGRWSNDSHGPGVMPHSVRRRRPSGKPAPLPRPLRTTGVGWLIAAGGSRVVLCAGVHRRVGSCRGHGDGGRRRHRPLGGGLAGTRAVHGDEGVRRRGVVGGDHRVVVGTAVDPVDPQALAASVCCRDCVDAAGPGDSVRAGPAAAPASAVRGGVPDRLEGLGIAVRADRGLGRRPARNPLLARARGPLAQTREVRGRRIGRARRLR